jgi:arylsulfatase A-like enzyme
MIGGLVGLAEAITLQNPIDTFFLNIDRSVYLYAFLLYGFLIWLIFALIRIFMRRPLIPSLIAAVIVPLGSLLFLASLFYAFVPPYRLLTTTRTIRKQNLPNVILITLDTTRADHLGCYGYGVPTSPFIDSLAAQGTLFQNAYTAATWTLPAHVSLFTGQMPSVHGVGYSNFFASPNLNTLAEILKQRGYITAGFTGGPFLSSAFHVHQGFDYYDEKLDANTKLKRMFVLRAVSNLFHLQWKTVGQRNAETINRSLFPFLNWAARKKQPFFLFVNYFDPHEPYNPPEQYRRLLNIKTSMKGNIRFYPLNKKTGVAQHQDGSPLTPDEFRDLQTLYDGEIRALDDQLRLLWAKLKELGLLNKSLLILTADHGETIGEHSFLDHGHNLYQEQVRIPLLITGFGRWNLPRVIESPARIIDILPTILEELKIPTPPNIQGQSLVQALSSVTKTAALIPAENDTDMHPRFAAFRRSQRMILNDSSKYIQSSDRKDLFFNLATDPSELQNLIVSDRNSADASKKLLSDYFGKLKPAHKGKGKMDPETRERLKALGYIE